MSFLLNKKYNILILGSNGMLGHDAYAYFTKRSQEKGTNIGTVIGLDVEAGIDFSKQYTLANYFKNCIHYDYCINCIAYTNTYAAEDYDAGYEPSFKLNALVPKYVAEACKLYGTKLIHISTDYVFSEKSASFKDGISETFLSFNTYNSEVFPVNVYGMHKLLGEMFIDKEFDRDDDQYAILRTSWLYGMHNNKSFIHKFLANVKHKLSKDLHAKIEVTENEKSVPTSTAFVVSFMDNVIDSNLHGIMHAIPSCEPGGVSRLEFAKEILKSFGDAKLCLDQSANVIELQPYEYKSYQPAYSVMFPYGINAKSWNYYLNEFITQNCDKLLDYIKSV